MTAKPVQRIRSTRAYRRIMDELIQQARRGEIPWSQVNQATNALKAACEAMMAENVLRASGIVDVEGPEHELGKDGGLEDFSPHKKARLFKKRKYVRKTGVGAKGVQIDEQTDTTEDA